MYNSIDINLTLYSASYDIMYFYISTYNSIMASNKSDTPRYSKRNISPDSVQMAVLISSSTMKVRLRYSSLCKHLKTFINETTVAEMFINP